MGPFVLMDKQAIVNHVLMACGDFRFFAHVFVQLVVFMEYFCIFAVLTKDVAYVALPT